jgi:hypothetical protein
VKLDIAVEEARAELEFATRKFGPFSSPHEAMSVIREEYLEMEPRPHQHSARQSSGTRYES